MYRDILVTARKSNERITDLFEKRFTYICLGTESTATAKVQRSFFKKAAEVDKEIATETARGKIACSNAEIVIALLPTYRLRKIFYMRYVLHCDWDYVTKKMREEKEYRIKDLKTVRRLHIMGLRFLRSVEKKIG